MDGNNRWSKKNKLSKYESYKKGANNLLNLTNFIFNNTKSNYISAFALSKNNLNRSQKLISLLISLLSEFVDNLLNDKVTLKFNIKFIGDRSFLNLDINQKIDKLEKTNLRSNKYLNIFINYSGKDDINQAAQNYYLYQKKNRLKKKFEDFLLTKGLPDPDILIRTGGYARLSDFIIYQSTFTEFFFTNKLWPDLSKGDLLKIFNKYYLLERKFGL